MIDAGKPDPGFIDRRTFLRGAGGVGIALPFLEAMSPRAALAQAAPKRYRRLLRGHVAGAGQRRPPGRHRPRRRGRRVPVQAADAGAGAAQGRHHRGQRSAHPHRRPGRAAGGLSQEQHQPAAVGHPAGGHRSQLQRPHLRSDRRQRCRPSAGRPRCRSCPSGCRPRPTGAAATWASSPGGPGAEERPHRQPGSGLQQPVRRPVHPARPAAACSPIRPRPRPPIACGARRRQRAGPGARPRRPAEARVWARPTSSGSSGTSRRSASWRSAWQPSRAHLHRGRTRPTPAPGGCSACPTTPGRRPGVVLDRGRGLGRGRLRRRGGAGPGADWAVWRRRSPATWPGWPLCSTPASSAS